MGDIMHNGLRIAEPPKHTFAYAAHLIYAVHVVLRSEKIIVYRVPRTLLHPTCIPSVRMYKVDPRNLCAVCAVAVDPRVCSITCAPAGVRCPIFSSIIAEPPIVLLAASHMTARDW